MLFNLFASTGMKVMGGASALLLAGCAFCYFQWQHTDTKLDNTRAELKGANDTIDALEADIAGLMAAAIERAEDEEVSRTEREELDNAANNPNDDAGDSNLRVLCLLRQQQLGTTDGLPAACERFNGSS